MRKKAYNSLSTTAVLTGLNALVFCDASSAAFSVTLPAASVMPGEVLYIKKTDATFNAITVTRAGSDTIDGSTTRSLATRGEWIKLLSQGSSWVTLESGYFEGCTSFTPTGSWSSNTTYTGYWWRVGDRISFFVKVATSGAPTSAALTVNAPTGVTFASGNSTAAITPLGYATCVDSGVDNYIAIPVYNDTGSVALKKDDGDGTYSNVTQAAPFTFGASDSVQIWVKDVQVSGWTS